MAWETCILIVVFDIFEDLLFLTGIYSMDQLSKIVIRCRHGDLVEFAGNYIKSQKI